MIIGLLGGLLGCQAIIGLDPGKPRPLGQGGAGGVGVESSTSSGSSGDAGGSSASSGGSGGSSASTGASSSSSGAGGGVINISMQDMIDDMEHGNGSIITQSGRVGSWFTYNDGTGTQMPASGTMCAPVAVGYAPPSMHSQHTKGMDFMTWGAGLGFDLNHSGMGPKNPYDVMNFKGIAFWAKGDATIEFKVVTTETVVAPDGTCDPMAGKCGDSYQEQITLTAGWTQYAVRFNDVGFKQAGWGTKVPFNPKSVITVQFAVDQTAGSFEFWIDDVGFF